MAKHILKPLRLHCPSWLLTLLVSAYLVIMFNDAFFSTVQELHGIAGLQGMLYMASLFIFLLVIINFFLTLLAIPWVLKPTVILLLISASAASYFMQTYNIMIDKTMIQNLMATDIKESKELLNFNLVIYITLTGLLPALLVSRITVNYGSPLRFVLSKLVTTTATIVVIGLIATFFYQDYASLFRNHKYVRDLAVPVNYIHALQSYAKQLLPENKPVFQTIGLDSHLGDSWKATSDKKVVSIVIVGETARSANFSLYGYPRETTPNLAKEDVISFSHVASCGTATAVSLPCMFSRLDRSNFDNMQAEYSENLLDVMQRAGLRVVWRDNNSGCKDVCDRVESETVDRSDDSASCSEDGCFDMMLLNHLEQTIAASDKDVVIVMHQLGSHGPAYFLRTPPAFQKFKPFCHTNQLQECSQQEITNAYDNTILYTDYFISRVIEFLKSHSDQFDASMVYVSDHGESLGENNLYLHGLPYMLAPDQQTHVPLIMWMGDSFAQRFSINKDCLKNKSQDNFTHDNLFDSLLGMLDVKTSVYHPQQDIFNSCSGTKAPTPNLAALYSEENK